jgi:recombination protein RecR
MSAADFPQPVRELIDSLKRLPGIGPRSAERIAVWLLQHPKADPSSLASAIQGAKESVKPCTVCGFFASSAGCGICEDPKRDNSLLCVVEQATDVLPLERSGSFRGRYHCLGGKLSPLDRVTPEDLRIRELLARIPADQDPVEVILALGSDVEGEATANYLAGLLRNLNCRVSRIAQGLPAGGGLEHADPLTLQRAMQGRRTMQESPQSAGQTPAKPDQAE